MAMLLAVMEVIALSWGALTFGAVYPWGYWPLIGASAAVGVLAVLFVRSRVRGLWRVAASLAAVAAVIGLQLIKVPAMVIARVSPLRDAFLKRYDVLYATQSTSGSHALSMNPGGTLVALSCFAAFSLLLLATARIASVRGVARQIARGIAVFGLGLALFALAQNLALDNQAGEGHTILIYGIWPDPYVNKPFGPFINKNNYAGWMLMAMPLAVGYVGASMTRLWRSVRPDGRSRLLALSSKDGANAVLAAIAALVMGVSIIVSMSRSGMIALAATMVGVAWFAPASESARRGRGARLGVAAAALLVLVAWSGADTIRNRFEDRTDASIRGRLIAWQNAERMVREFPIAGLGFNAFKTAMTLDQQGDSENFWEEVHNDYLQIAAEGGLIGLAVVITAIVVVVVEIRRRFAAESSARSGAWLRAGAVAGLCAIAVQEIVEFSLQIPANAALFAVLMGIALHDPPRAAARAPRMMADARR
jgi:O-antigen ligase